MPDPFVVLIEDEPQIRRFLRATLTGEGYRLFEATKGADGLVEVGSRQPDVVIVDLGLPDLEGLEEHPSRQQNRPRAHPPAEALCSSFDASRVLHPATPGTRGRPANEVSPRVRVRGCAGNRE